MEIHSLQNAKELNGRRGRVAQYVVETSRYDIKLDGDDSGDIKAIRLTNLRKLADDEGGDDEDASEKRNVQEDCTKPRKSRNRPPTPFNRRKRDSLKTPCDEEDSVMIGEQLHGLMHQKQTKDRAVKASSSQRMGDEDIKRSIDLVKTSFNT